MTITFEERRLDRMFFEIKERIPLYESTLLTPSTVYGIIPQSELPSRPNQVNRDDYTVHPAKVGDFVISMSSFLHGFEYCGIEGGISPDYTLLRPNFSADIGRFLKYSLKSDILVQQLGSFRTGIRQGQRLKWNKVRYVKIPFPDKSSAKIVADFLDQETLRIDQLIEKKWNLIETLPLRVEAIIDKALSASDTKWLRFGHAAKMVFRTLNREDKELYVPIGLYNRGRGIFHKEETQGQDLGDSTFSWIKQNDLIFSGQFAWEGAVALASKREENKIASHRYPIYNGRDGIESAYLFSYFRTHRGKFLMNDCSRGAAGRNKPLNTSRLEKEQIPIPSASIQKQVVEFVEQENILKAKITESIQGLNKFRASLITEAVTGQLDIDAWKKRDTGNRQIDHIEQEIEQEKKGKKARA